MSKGRIDISSAVDGALIKAGVKTQALLNEVRRELQNLESQGVTIEGSLVKAIADHIKETNLRSFSVSDLDKVMANKGISRPKSAQVAARGLKEKIEAKLAEHFYDVSERYGTSYQDIGNSKSENATAYKTLASEIEKEIKAAYGNNGISFLDVTALQGLVSDLCNVNIGEGVVVFATKKSDAASDKTELNSRKRFNLMAQEAARRALAPKVTDPARIKQLAEMIIVAGSGSKATGGDLFKDFQFAVKSDIGKSDVSVKMLHELPEIKAIAEQMANDPTFSPPKNYLESILKANKEKYVFGRKYIVIEGIKLIAEEAVKASVSRLAEVSKDPYLQAAAKELKSTMAHDVDQKFADKVTSEIVKELMKNHVSTKALAEGDKMTVKDLAARLAHPVGRGLLEAAVSKALLERTKTLETVSKGLFEQIYDGWTAMKGATGKATASALKAASKRLGVTKDYGWAKWLKGNELEASGVANAALKDFLKFDPRDPNTFPAADKLKVDVNQQVAGRTEVFAQASMAVDKMVTEEMRSVDGRQQPKFNLHPLVRESLVRYLYENPNLDQVAFCKSLCDKFIERGRANKTITLAHFEEKGDRTQGTWNNYFRKCLQSFRKLPIWSYFPELPSLFTQNAAALTMMLDGVKKSVETGITPPKVYSSHRDAQTAVQLAIAEFNREHASAGGIKVDSKTYPEIRIDKDVRDALVRQVTRELEKARLEGKNIYLDKIVAALQPGMEELATRTRDPLSGEITAKTVQQSALPAAFVPGYKKPEVNPSQTLADFCKEVVGMEYEENNVIYSIKTMGMTQAEVIEDVLEKAMSGHTKGVPGYTEVRNNLKKAISDALQDYDTKTGKIDVRKIIEQAPYNSTLIVELEAKVKACITTIQVPVKNKKDGSTIATLSVDEEAVKKIKEAALQRADSYNEERAALEESRKAEALAHVHSMKSAAEPAVINLAGGGVALVNVASKDIKDPEYLLPTLNSAKAFLEYIANNSKSNPDYCIQLINDPKYAEILHYSRFKLEGEFMQLGQFLEGKVDKVISDAVKSRQSQLAEFLDLSPASDIRKVAQAISDMDKAGLGGAKSSASIFLGLLDGTVVSVEGVGDKPILLEASSVGTRSKAEELLRFVHNHKDKDPAALNALTADFIKEKNITQKEIDSCKVNGAKLIDHVNDEYKLDISVMKTKAAENLARLAASAKENSDLKAAQAMATKVADAITAKARTKREAGKAAEAAKAAAPLLERLAAAEAELAGFRSGPARGRGVGVASAPTASSGKSPLTVVRRTQLDPKRAKALLEAARERTAETARKVESAAAAEVPAHGFLRGLAATAARSIRVLPGGHLVVGNDPKRPGSTPAKKRGPGSGPTL